MGKGITESGTACPPVDPEAACGKAHLARGKKRSCKTRCDWGKLILLMDQPAFAPVMQARFRAGLSISGLLLQNG